MKSFSRIPSVTWRNGTLWTDEGGSVDSPTSFIMLVRNYNLTVIAEKVSLSDKYLIITYPGSRHTKVLDTQNVWEVREQAVGGEMGVSISHGPNLASPDTIKCKCPKPQELIQRVRDLKNRHSWFSYDEILRTSFDIFKLECDEESHPTKLQAFANSLNTTESNKAGLKNIKDKIPNINRYDYDDFTMMHAILLLMFEFLRPRLRWSNLVNSKIGK